MSAIPWGIAVFLRERWDLVAFALCADKGLPYVNPSAATLIRIALNYPSPILT